MIVAEWVAIWQKTYDALRYVTPRMKSIGTCWKTISYPGWEISLSKPLPPHK